MGGISSAAVGLRVELARRGHEVHYFATAKSPQRHDGVWLQDRSKLAEFASSRTADALIVIPDLLPLLVPLRTRVRVIWTGNAFSKGDFALIMPWHWAPALGKRGKEARLYPMSLFDRHINHVVVGSTWQAEQLTRRSGIAPNKLSVIHLGVQLEYYRKPGPNRHPHRLIYTSQAYRGLDALLQLFPQIRKHVPDAQLLVFGNEYSEAGVPPERPGASQPGVVWGGAVGKSLLAQQLRSSAVMAYPASFQETFCIAVAEAQAAGLPIVTTDLAALAERVDDGHDGFLVAGSARESEYQDTFVKHVARLLQDDELRTRMSSAAESKAERLYDWATIGAQWEAMLQDLVATHVPSIPRMDPDLDLLDDALLQVRAPQARATVPPDLALQWLRERWTSYGFSADTLPGVSASI